MAWDPDRRRHRRARLRRCATGCSASSATGPRRWSPAGRAPTRSPASPTAASTRTWRATTTTCACASSSTAAASRRRPPRGSTTTGWSASSRAPSRRRGLCPPDPEYPGLAEPGALAEVDHFDPDTAAGVARRPRRGRRRLRRRRARPRVGRLLLHRRRHPRAVLHHRAPLREPLDDGAGRRHPPRRGGRRAAHRRLRPDDLASGWRDLDGRRVGDVAAAKATRRRQPDRARARHLRGGARGQGGGGHAAVPGLARASTARPTPRARASPTSARRSSTSAISLWDDGTDPRSLGRPYDAEGTPKRRVDLVAARGHGRPRPRPAQRGAGRASRPPGTRSARSPSAATPATCSSTAATSRSSSSSPASSGVCSSPTSGTTASSIPRPRSSPASPATACSSSRAAR